LAGWSQADAELLEEGTGEIGMFDKLRALLSVGRGGAQRQAAEQRYDNVEITFPDGTAIKGHDAVKAHFEREEKLLAEHGDAIIFQVYRINMGAKTLRDLTGDKLAQTKVTGGFVSGTDTVLAVKSKVRPLFDGTAQSGYLNIGKADQISLFFDGRLMQDNKLFYADHFMLLPVWVQVYLHACALEEVADLERKLRLQVSEQ
jgi:hypothetical protein